MADIFTATGVKVYIGPSVASTPADAAAYAALSWDEVGLVRSVGEFGDQSSIVSAAVLGDGRMRKAKAARDAGEWQLVVFPDSADDGQQALIAAEATYNNYAFKVVLPNRLDAGGTDEINYFKGLVTSKRRSIGENDAIVQDTFAIAINSPIVVVPPTAAP